MSAAPRMDGPAWAMLLVLSVLWGGSFVFAEIMLEALPVLTVVALRVTIAAAVLWAVVAATGTRVSPAPAIVAAFAVMGLLNNAVPFTLIVFGQQTVTAGLAAVLNATTPLFTGLLAGLLLADERLTAGRLFGLALGLSGVVAMIGPDALTAVGEHLWAEVAILGAALSYAAAAVFARRFRRLGVPPLAIAAGQCTASAALLVPLALAVDEPLALPMPGAGVWAAVLVNAVLSTALAYVLYFAVLARAGATNVALVTVLVPVVAVLVGAVALGEAVTAGQIGGMALIFAGLSVIDGRLWRPLVARRARPAAEPEGRSRL